jgi:translocation and assembly module TamA
LIGPKRVGLLTALAFGPATMSPVGALDNVTIVAPGVENDLAERLRNASLLASIPEEDATEVQEVLAAARAEYARMLGVLYDEGYFGGVVNVLVDGREAADLSPLDPPGSIRSIELRVQPGPRYRFSRAEVDPLAPDTELPEGFALGEPARVPAIRNAVTDSVSAWRDAGYAKADVAAQEIVARHPEQRVEASIDVAPGPRVQFGRFDVVGNEQVREGAIRRIAGFPEGERFSPERMERSARRLRDTGAFRSVALSEAEDLQPGDVLPITATVVEEEPRRFGFGAEYDSSDGALLSAFWLHRNLLGGAERLRFDAQVGGVGSRREEGEFNQDGIDASLGVAFTRPATLNPDTDFVIGLSASQDNEPDFSSQSLAFSTGFSRNIRDRFIAEARVGYLYSRDEDERGVTEYSLLTFPLSASSDRRNDQLNPTGGWYAAAGATPFVGLNDASGTGARLTGDGRVYLGFGEDDRFVAAARLQVGSIVGAELLDVPNDYRFYSGGGGTVRGFEYESLGVTLGDGIDSGGASFFAVSGEARIGVTENIQGVAFVDYGYVGENSFYDDTGDDQVGAGLGVRYVTPIGPIRLDVAVPVSGESEADYQVYVGIGQAF